MKNSIIAALVCLAGTAMGQTVWNETGIVTGPNIRYALNKPENVTYKANAGFAVGFSNNLHISPHSSIYLGIMYEEQNLTGDSYPTIDPIFYIARRRFKKQYIAVPLMYRYTFGKKRVQPFVNAGLQFDFGYRQRTTFYYDVPTIEPWTVVEKNSDFNLNVAVGGGVKMKVNDRVSLTAEYRQTFFMLNNTRYEISGDYNTIKVGDDFYVPFSTSYFLIGAAVKVGKKG